MEDSKIEALLGQEISYNAQSDTVGLKHAFDKLQTTSKTEAAIGGSSLSLSWDWYDDWRTDPHYRHYYPYSTPIIAHEDTYRKAFNVAKMLLKKKLLKSNKLGEFVSLVEMIADNI